MLAPLENMLKATLINVHFVPGRLRVYWYCRTMSTENIRMLLLLPVTHSSVGSTLQVSGRNCKLLVYLEVRDRIVD